MLACLESARAVHVGQLGQVGSIAGFPVIMESHGSIVARRYGRITRFPVPLVYAASMTDLYTQLGDPPVAQSNGRMVPVPRRRLRGVRLTALPSWPLAAQVLGGVGGLAGVWHQWGWSVAAMVGGAIAVAVGALREGGKI
jgi:hypothetical protein